MDDGRPDSCRSSDEDEGNASDDGSVDHGTILPGMLSSPESGLAGIRKRFYDMDEHDVVKLADLLNSDLADLVRWYDEHRDRLDKDPLLPLYRELLPDCAGHGGGRWSCLFDCVPPASASRLSQRIRSLAKQYRLGLSSCPRSCWISILLAGNCLGKLYGLHRPAAPLPCCRDSIGPWRDYEEEMNKMEEEVIERTVRYTKLAFTAIGIVLLSWKISSCT